VLTCPTSLEVVLARSITLHAFSRNLQAFPLFAAEISATDGPGGPSQPQDNATLSFHHCML